MKLLNIHGYGGILKNSAYAALQENDIEVCGRTIAYDIEEPSSILKELEKMIQSEGVTGIVGTSLGGFYATVLSIRYNMPVALVNPCLLPFVQLPRIGYPRDVREFLPYFAELKDLREDKTWVILGGSDEVIDTHDVTRQMFPHVTYTVIPEGKHSGATLPLIEYFKTIWKKD